MILAGLLAEGEEPTKVEWENFREHVVNTLLLCNNNPELAIRALGLATDQTERIERRRIIAAIYGDERTIAKLQALQGDVDVHKDSILARQIHTAKFGSPEDAVRAAAFVAKVAGWYAAEKHEHKVEGGVTIHSLLKNETNVKAFLDRTSHEPGAAIAVYSEVLDDVAALPPSHAEDAEFKESEPQS